MINLDNLKLIDGDLNSQAITQLIYENEGCFTKLNQNISFEDNDKVIDIKFEVYADGIINEDGGDYDTPPSCEITVTDTQVTIKEIYVDGELTNLDETELILLETMVENQMN